MFGLGASVNLREKLDSKRRRMNLINKMDTICMQWESCSGNGKSDKQLKNYFKSFNRKLIDIFARAIDNHSAAKHTYLMTSSREIRLHLSRHDSEDAKMSKIENRIEIETNISDNRECTIQIETYKRNIQTAVDEYKKKLWD
jgi:hypothetical protein